MLDEISFPDACFHKLNLHGAYRLCGFRHTEHPGQNGIQSFWCY